MEYFFLKFLKERHLTGPAAASHFFALPEIKRRFYRRKFSNQNYLTMKMQSVLRLGLLGFLFLLLTAERCVEITEISAPAFVNPGSPFQVKTRMKHLENGQNDFNLDYYLSYDRIWNPEDIPLGSLALTAFPANHSREVSQTFSLPASTFMGHYYLIAKAQDGEMYRQIGVNGPVNVGVDFVPANLFSYGGDKPGESFRFAFSLYNRGIQQHSGQSYVRCYFSTDTKIDGGDRLVYTVPISSAFPGNSVREFAGLEFDIPDDLAAGDYFFILAADSGNAVAETGELNNYVSKLVKISAGLQGPAEERSDMVATPYFVSQAPTVALAPNPATTCVNVALQLPAPATVSLDVLDLSGRIVESFSEQKIDAGEYTQRIEVADWLAGTYLVRTRVDGKTTIRKVVKH